MPVTDKKLLAIAGYGRYAPSVHNTQPWLFEFDDDKIAVHINKNRLLDAGDPVKRQAWISLGCCVEAICVGSKSLGLEPSISAVNDGYVVIKFKDKPKRVNKHDTVLAKSISTRFTDRSVFSQETLSKAQLSTLQSIEPIAGTSIKVISDRDIIEMVAKLTSQGIRLALSNPDFRSELAKFVTPPLSRRQDGIPTSSLRLNTIGGLLELALIRSGLNIKLRAVQEYKSWNSASAIILVLSKGDSREYWLNAGRTYLRCALESTVLGLRSATSAAIVEAADFHEDIEKEVHSNMRLQTVMRVGKSDSKPVYSKRLPMELLKLH